MNDPNNKDESEPYQLPLDETKTLPDVRVWLVPSVRVKVDYAIFHERHQDDNSFCRIFLHRSGFLEWGGHYQSTRGHGNTFMRTYFWMYDRDGNRIPMGLPSGGEIRLQYNVAHESSRNERATANFGFIKDQFDKIADPGSRAWGKHSGLAQV